MLVKRTFLLGCVRRSWRGGVAWWGHVNVPCTSSATCCYAAQMSGSVVHEGMGCVGGMLTFLVLLPLLVATLHRCLAVACIHEGVGWGGMSTFLVLLPLHVATLHRCLLWKERKKEKAYQHAPMKWIQNPHETRFLPNYRARIWHHSACRFFCFALAKMRFVWKTLFLRARFPVRRDVYTIWVGCIRYTCLRLLEFEHATKA